VRDQRRLLSWDTLPDRRRKPDLHLERFDRAGRSVSTATRLGEGGLPRLANGHRLASVDPRPGALVRHLIAIVTLVLAAGCSSQPVGNEDGGATARAGTSTSSGGAGGTSTGSPGTSTGEQVSTTGGTSSVAGTGGGSGSGTCGQDDCPPCPEASSCTDDSCVDGTWQCVCSCWDGGATASCPGDAACPAGCVISSDCLSCLPESANAGIGMACQTTSDCCTGTCVQGLCSLGSSGGSSSGGSGPMCQISMIDTANFQPGVSFGKVAVGQTASAIVKLSNIGTLACSIDYIGIDPNDAFNEFALMGGTKSGPVLLAPGQSLPFVVTFSPTNGSPPLLRSADLAVTLTGAHSSIDAPLSGQVQ